MSEKNPKPVVRKVEDPKPKVISSDDFLQSSNSNERYHSSDAVPEAKPFINPVIIPDAKPVVLPKAQPVVTKVEKVVPVEKPEPKPVIAQKEGHLMADEYFGITQPEPVEAHETFSVDPGLLEKMLRIGDNAYWNRILETFVSDMDKRYGRQL